MFSQKDVAKRAGVSMMTVSRVINNNGDVKDETRRRVYEAIKELEYYPNNLGRSLNNNRVNVIAVLAPLVGIPMENHPYYTRLLYGIEVELMEHSYDILLSTQRKRQIDGKFQFNYFRPFMERKADALILMGAKPNRDDLETIRRNKIPFCVIGDRPKSSHVDIVDTRNREGMKLMLEQFYDMGHRDIAFAGLDTDNFNISERHEGYREFLEEKGIPYRDEWIFKSRAGSGAGLETIGEYRALAEVGRAPSLFVCGTDDYALDLLRAAHGQGLRVPDDLSISGFDGIPLGQYGRPRLTSMIQPLEDMGMKAAELILKRLLHPEEPCGFELFDSTYLPGESVGTIRR